MGAQGPERVAHRRRPPRLVVLISPSPQRRKTAAKNTPINRLVTWSRYPADDPKWKPGTWAGSWGEFSSTRYKIENLNAANQAGLAGPGGWNDPGEKILTQDEANCREFWPVLGNIGQF